MGLKGKVAHVASSLITGGAALEAALSCTVCLKYHHRALNQRVGPECLKKNDLQKSAVGCFLGRVFAFQLYLMTLKDVSTA